MSMRVHELRVRADVIAKLETGAEFAAFSAPNGDYRVGDFAVLINSQWAKPDAPADIETVRIDCVDSLPRSTSAILTVSRCDAAADLDVIRAWRADETVAA